MVGFDVLRWMSDELGPVLGVSVPLFVCSWRGGEDQLALRLLRHVQEHNVMEVEYISLPAH